MKFDVLVTGPAGVLPTIIGYRERKNDMSEMIGEIKEHYLDEADKHANFLADKVWKPAFVMAFIHGVKHGREDVTNELKAKQLLDYNKLKLKDKLNREHKLRQRNKKRNKKDE